MAGIQCDRIKSLAKAFASLPDLYYWLHNIGANKGQFMKIRHFFATNSRGFVFVDCNKCESIRWPCITHPIASIDGVSNQSNNELKTDRSFLNIH